MAARGKKSQPAAAPTVGASAPANGTRSAVAVHAPPPGTVVSHQVLPPKVADVPTDPKAAPNERHFRVAHTMVGPYEKDRVVSESDLKEILGHENDHGKHLNRLVKIGAIVQTNLDLSTNPLPPGPYNTGADSGTEAPLLSTDSKPGDVPSDLPGVTDLESGGDDSDKEEDGDEEDEDTDDEESESDEDGDDDDDEDDDDDDDDEVEDTQSGGSRALPNVPKPPGVK